ncbi:MAG: hypothetical protein GY812_16930 [Actinomycetia bacterium]|nr:hypothetical protein [Actinomycetes bacterium]
MSRSLRAQLVFGLLLALGCDAQEGDGEPDVETPAANGSGPEISVRPRALDFGEVPANERATEVIVVSNVGTGRLRLTQVSLNGSEDFLFAIGGAAPRRRPEVLEDPDLDGTPGLHRGQSIEVSITVAS